MKPTHEMSVKLTKHGYMYGVSDVKVGEDNSKQELYNRVQKRIMPYVRTVMQMEFNRTKGFPWSYSLEDYD